MIIIRIVRTLHNNISNISGLLFFHYNENYPGHISFFQLHLLYPVIVYTKKNER